MDINFLTSLFAELKERGVTCSAYIYNAREKEYYKYPVDNPDLRRKFLGGHGMDYKEISFNSIISTKENPPDLVVLPTKKNGKF